MTFKKAFLSKNERSFDCGPLNHFHGTRAAHDKEVNAFSKFFNLVYSTYIMRGVEDEIFCYPSIKGKFIVRPYYHTMITYTTNLFLWMSI